MNGKRLGVRLVAPGESLNGQPVGKLPQWAKERGCIVRCLFAMNVWVKAPGRESPGQAGGEGSSSRMPKPVRGNRVAFSDPDHRTSSVRVNLTTFANPRHHVYLKIVAVEQAAQVKRRRREVVIVG